MGQATMFPQSVSYWYFPSGLFYWDRSEWRSFACDKGGQKECCTGMLYRLILEEKKNW